MGIEVAAFPLARTATASLSSAGPLTFFDCARVVSEKITGATRYLSVARSEYNLPKLNRGEFMGLLDGVLGGLVGAGINQIIQTHGGVQGLVNQFEQKGLGGIAQSWVGTGTNQPVSADQLLHVLGSDNVAQFAGKLNVSPEELLNKLSELLPEHIDKMTPGGVIPKG